jgi:hypothetical protein
MRNRTEHGFSRLTAISDAGSTPAASTNLRHSSRVERLDIPRLAINPIVLSIFE